MATVTLSLCGQGAPALSIVPLWAYAGPDRARISFEGLHDSPRGTSEE